MQARLEGSAVQWDALRAIARYPGASAHELAVATFQTDQSFGTLANRLEAQGLIVRAPGRGRRIEHRLTVVGTRKLDEANVIADKKRHELFAVLSDSEFSDLNAEFFVAVGLGLISGAVLQRSNFV